MDALAERLARTTDLPVVNQTGLAGVFNLRLTWTPDNDQPKPERRPRYPSRSRNSSACN